MININGIDYTWSFEGDDLYLMTEDSNVIFWMGKHLLEKEALDCSDRYKKDNFITSAPKWQDDEFVNDYIHDDDNVKRFCIEAWESREVEVEIDLKKSA